MGLASMGGVHSSLSHVYEFLSVAKQYGLGKVFVHCFMDGRDTDPKSGKGFVEELEKNMAATTGKVASVCGRYYAMDRDKRWERVKLAYDSEIARRARNSSRPPKASRHPMPKV